MKNRTTKQSLVAAWLSATPGADMCVTLTPAAAAGMLLAQSESANIALETLKLFREQMPNSAFWMLVQHRLECAADGEVGDAA